MWAWRRLRRWLRDGRIRCLGQRDDHDDRRHGQTGLLRGRRPGDHGAVVQPHGVAVDGQGNIYIADTSNHRVRKVSPAGRSRLSQARAEAAPSGDGGPATSALLYAADWGRGGPAGNVYIAEGGQPGAQGQARRDDHDDRRHGPARLLSGTAVRRPRRSSHQREWRSTERKRLHRRHWHHACARSAPTGRSRRSPGRGAWLLRRRRPGDLGAAKRTPRGGGGQGGERLHRRHRQQPRAQGQPAGRSPRSPAPEPAGFPGTAARRPRRGCRARRGWRWTAGKRLHRRLPQQPCAEGEQQGDDHDCRRRRLCSRSGRGWRPGDLGEGDPAWGGSGPTGKRLHRRSTRIPAVRKVLATATAVAAVKLTLGAECPRNGCSRRKGIRVTASRSKPCSLAATGSVTILGTWISARPPRAQPRSSRPARER